MNQPTPFQKWFDSELARQGAKWDDFNSILLLTKIIAEQTWNAALDAASRHIRVMYEGLGENYRTAHDCANAIQDLKSTPLSDSSIHSKSASA